MSTSFKNQFHAMASFMGPPPNYQQSNNGSPYAPPPGPPPSHNNMYQHNNFNLQVSPPTPVQNSNIDPNLTFAVQPPPGPPPTHERAPQPNQPQRVFPPHFTLYYKDSLSSVLSEGESLKFTLGTDPENPLYIANLESSTLKGPKMTLAPAWDKKLPPLAHVKTKGLKDSTITVEPPPGSNEPQLIEKLTCKFGMSSRTYSFAYAVPSPFGGAGKRETFSWKREGPQHGGNGKKQSKLDKWGLGMGSMDMDDDLGLQTKRELIRESNGEVVARWVEDDGSSMTKTGRFEFVNSGARVEAFGPQWEIMAVVSVLRIWHEDYHVAKKVAEALGGA